MGILHGVVKVFDDASDQVTPTSQLSDVIESGEQFVPLHQPTDQTLAKRELMPR